MPLIPLFLQAVVIPGSVLNDPSVGVQWKLSKDDGDITEWSVDYTGEMAKLSDVIETSIWTLADGLTKISESHTDNIATVKISGGVEGQKYNCVNTIATGISGETFTRTQRLTVKQVTQ